MGLRDFFTCCLKSRSESPVRGEPSFCPSVVCSIFFLFPKDPTAQRVDEHTVLLPPPSQETYKYASPSLRSEATYVNFSSPTRCVCPTFGLLFHLRHWPPHPMSQLDKRPRPTTERPTGRNHKSQERVNLLLPFEGYSSMPNALT